MPLGALLKEGIGTANLRAKTLDFRGFELERNLNLKGWKSHVLREVPGKFESSNLSRDNLSREIGRKAETVVGRQRSEQDEEGAEARGWVQTVSQLQ